MVLGRGAIFSPSPLRGEGRGEGFYYETPFHFIQTSIPIHFTLPPSFVKTVTPSRAYAQKMVDA